VPYCAASRRLPQVVSEFGSIMGADLAEYGSSVPLLGLWTGHWLVRSQ
jgi:hypothetical protein